MQGFFLGFYSRASLFDVCIYICDNMQLAIYFLVFLLYFLLIVDRLVFILCSFIEEPTAFIRIASPIIFNSN